MDPTDPLWPCGLHMLSRWGEIFTEEVTFKQDLRGVCQAGKKVEEKEDYPEDIEKLSLEKKDNSSAWLEDLALDWAAERERDLEGGNR